MTWGKKVLRLGIQCEAARGQAASVVLTLALTLLSLFPQSFPFAPDI